MFKIKDVGGKPKNGLGFFCHINFNKKVYSFIVINGQGPQAEKICNIKISIDNKKKDKIMRDKI